MGSGRGGGGMNGKEMLRGVGWEATGGGGWEREKGSF